MNFAEMEKIDVTKHIEKKGKFSYLSWPFAVAEFRKACPDGWWKVNRWGDKPYYGDQGGCYVTVTVYPDKSSEGFEQIHPVLDHHNKPIMDPNAFQINTSIQRCLVKAIAIATGIGLHIYAGEDLPPDESGERQKSAAKKKPAAKKPASWTPAQLKELGTMSMGLGIDDNIKAQFTGWLAKRFDADTFQEIPVNRRQVILNQFDELYDEFCDGR